MKHRELRWVPVHKLPGSVLSSPSCWSPWQHVRWSLIPETTSMANCGRQCGVQGAPLWVTHTAPWRRALALQGVCTALEIGTSSWSMSKGSPWHRLSDSAPGAGVGPWAFPGCNWAGMLRGVFAPFTGRLRVPGHRALASLSMWSCQARGESPYNQEQGKAGTHEGPEHTQLHCDGL